jgi:hypothetical protein
MVGVNVFAADTDAEARRQFTSLQQAFLGIIRGARTELQPPVDRMDGKWTLQEQSHVKGMTRVSAVGSPATVRAALEALLTETGADELIVTAQIHDHDARLRSFELTADVFKAIHATYCRSGKTVWQYSRSLPILWDRADPRCPAATRDAGRRRDGIRDGRDLGTVRPRL